MGECDHITHSLASLAVLLAPVVVVLLIILMHELYKDKKKGQR